CIGVARRPVGAAPARAVVLRGSGERRFDRRLRGRERKRRGYSRGEGAGEHERAGGTADRSHVGLLADTSLLPRDRWGKRRRKRQLHTVCPSTQRACLGRILLVIVPPPL